MVFNSILAFFDNLTTVDSCLAVPKTLKVGTIARNYKRNIFSDLDSQALLPGFYIYTFSFFG